MQRAQFFVTAAPGVRISAFDFGGSGPALLIAGANGFHALCYRELARHLCRHFHCYGVDLRGQGDSRLQVPTDAPQAASGGGFGRFMAAQPDLPTIEGFVEDVRAVLAHLGCQDCYFFGHSGGGCAALAAAVRLRSQVCGVFAFEPVIVPPEDLREADGLSAASNELARMALRRRDRFPSHTAALANLSGAGKAFGRFHPAVLADYVEHGFANTPGGGCELKCSRECEAVLYLTIQRMSAPFVPALRQLACPLTLAVGASQQLGGMNVAGCARATAATLDRPCLEAHERLDHFAPFVEPAFVAERIVAAFSRPQSKL